MYFAKVIVWSAGDRDYVHNMVKSLFKHHPDPDAIYTRDHIKYKNRKTEDYYKPLSAIEGIDFSKTLFLDNKKDNFRENEDNGIHIPDYEPETYKGGAYAKDKYLYLLMNWLLRDEVMNCKDVRKLSKTDIFKTATGEIIIERKKHQDMTREHKFLFTPVSL